MNDQTARRFDLEERTLNFANKVRGLIKDMPKTIAAIEDGKQVIRSSGSIGANYIEANESISKKDFLFRLKICRKEAKETRYWLILLNNQKSDLENLRQILIREATELMMIFGSIIRKLEN
jgi:four helix bundle protein